jgi:hypothetical protein
LKEAERRDGHCLPRTNLVNEDPAVLWDRYMQLTQIEAAFKCLKNDLGICPIYHQLEHWVEAHIMVAFLAYCPVVTLKHRLQSYAPAGSSSSASSPDSALPPFRLPLPNSRCSGDLADAFGLQKTAPASQLCALELTAVCDSACSLWVPG